jgi:zinc protease
MKRTTKSLSATILAATAASMMLAWPTLASEGEVFIPYDEFYLDNGLRVIVHEDRKAPIVAVTVWYHVGSKDELPGRTGFGHLFEHLMFNGTENYDAEYFGPFQQVGATSMNGTIDFDRTAYFQTVPTTALDLALWMESDRMGHLLGAVTQEKLDVEVGVVANEKRQRQGQPYGTALDSVFGALFPAPHPYSWMPIGSIEDLEAATLEDVHRWFETWYGPNNATLVLAGDIDLETAKRKVQHYFGDIEPGPPIERQLRNIPPDLATQRIRKEDRVPQARVYRAWLGPEWLDDDATRIHLANRILTGGRTARLDRRLVYEDQIATSIGSYAFTGEIAGAYIVWATVQPGGDIAEVERVLDEELQRFLEEGPTQQELDRVRTQVRAGFIRGIEQVGGFSGKSNILAEYAVFGGRPDFYRQSLQVMDEATPEDVRATAAAWIRGQGVTLEIHPFDGSLRAAGEGADRSALPFPDEFPHAPFPEMRQATLSNGMRLIVAERRAVPVVQFSLQMNAGYAADQFALPGTASLAMQMLDEGTRNRTSLEISERLANLGANLGTGANLDLVSVSLSALRENLDESLDIYADVILNPVFPDNELERLRRQRLSTIQQEQTTPMSMALRVFPSLLYGEGHAYALPMTGSGTPESVQAITREQLVDFHRTWFRPDNATLIVVGDTDLDDILPRVERLFAGWEPATVPDRTLPEVGRPDGPRVFLINRPGSEQSMIMAGQLVAPKREEDDLAIRTMNDVLGGNFMARINMNLREDKGWSYGASSAIVETAAQRPFIAYAPVQTDMTAPAMREMLREIEEITSARPITDDEVSTSKRRATLTLPGRWETANSVASDIAQLVRFGLPDDYWYDYADMVESLSVNQVRAAADSELSPGQLTWIVVGDLSLVEDEVRELGFGPVQVIDTEGNVIR